MANDTLQKVYEAVRFESQVLIVAGLGLIIVGIVQIMGYEKGSNDRLKRYGFVGLGIALIMVGVARIYLHPFRER